MVMGPAIAVEHLAKSLGELGAVLATRGTIAWAQNASTTTTPPSASERFR